MLLKSALQPDHLGHLSFESCESNLDTHISDLDLKQLRRLDSFMKKIVTNISTGSDHESFQTEYVF